MELPQWTGFFGFPLLEFTIWKLSIRITYLLFSSQILSKRGYTRRGGHSDLKLLWLRDNTCEEVVVNSWVEVHDPNPISVL